MRQRSVLLAVAAGAAVISAVIAFAYGYASHEPKPRDVRIAVAASPRLQAAVAGGLEEAVPGGFDLTATTPADAVDGVRTEEKDGALVLSPDRTAKIVTAAAGGLSQQQAIDLALNGVAGHLGYKAREVDVAPLPDGDRGGQSSFVYLLALLIPSVMGAVGVFVVGAKLRIWWRVLAAISYSVLAALVTVLILDPGLGALTGAPFELFGFGVLGAMTCLVVVIAFQALLGLPGTGIGAFVFLFVGNAMSGGTVPRSFLPGGFRQISGWLPNSSIVELARRTVYFDSNGLGHPILVLGIWLGGSLAAILAIDVLQSRAVARYQVSPPEVYAKSVWTHLRTDRDKGTSDPTLV